jgi:hypothetical protein
MTMAAYEHSHRDATYAHIDGGEDNPGYFTAAVATTLPAKASRITTTYDSTTSEVVGYDIK